MNDKIKKIIATAVASLGLFVFAACGTDGGSGESGTGSGGGSSQLPEDGVNGGSNNGNGSNDNNGSDNNNGSGDNSAEKPSEPVIPTVPEGSVKITEAAGDLEAAYVVWDKVAGAMGYNVYVKGESGDYTQLDAPLVREYKDCFRADAVGLKAGVYTLKVVPTGGAELAEDESKAATATQITVLAHDRSGYAFVNGTSSGAYNEDGTLRENANVLYITDENKHSVKMTVSGTECVGLQAILTAYKKETKPLSVRFIGNIGVLDTATAMSDVGNFLIKETTAGVTVEGIGNDATANGWGLRIVRSSNVEIRNLGFMNTVGDGSDNVGIENSNDHIWVHNCDMFYGGAGGDADQAKGDGALDTKLSTYVTHSYNHFWDSGKCNLQGMKNEVTSNYITYHHNWYDHSDSRHPRIRTCTVHVYNNYFDGNAKYGVGVTYGASAFVENNYFRSTASMHPMLSSNQGTDALGAGTFSGEDGGMIKAFGNVFDCTASNLKLITQNDTADKTNLDCYLASSREEEVPAEYKAKQGGTAYSNFDTASDFYEYEVDTAEEAKEKIEKYAGRIGGGDFKWEFDDETEDANYAVIPELKAALTNYTSDLVKVGGIEVGTPDSGSTGGSTEEGGSTGGTETGPVAGEVSFIPTASGSGFTVTGGTKSHSEIVVAGVTVPKNTALKLDSGGKIEFTTTEIMILYIYVLNAKTVSVDGNEKTPVAEGGYYVISLELSAGDHTVVKGNGENSVYLIKLVPKTT
ncbi:MAG: pectate lyase [Clostridia bacterium]|nr:pectate lyase [Clostridia bacterium]